jgi:DNA-binding GntR family transcriptional regulator
MTQHTKGEDWGKLDRTDYQFHYTIVKASQHQRLIRSYENCHIQITGFRAGYAHLKSSSLDVTAREHLQIVKCIEQRDPQGAEKAACEHVSKALHSIQNHLGIRLQDLSKLRASRPKPSRRENAIEGKIPEKRMADKKGQWALV